MPDIRSQVSPDINGKLIYQLTSASALKDTDLFPISSTDNLTRAVSLGQIKASFNNDFYNKLDMNNLLDELRQQIKDTSDDLFNYGDNTTEFRNEFNNKLNELDNTLRQEINNIDKKFTDITNTITDNMNQMNTDLGDRITNLDTSLNNKITDLDTSLSKKITDLDTKLTNIITNWIQYGTTVPTTLATGRVYLQYF